ncbi:hypothetical protein BVI434_2280003 [Burkholderia vietnamiensis]|nr:hypothetical protein BVI434_2280003 [Burkholderia vietnamiensis]
MWVRDPVGDPGQQQVDDEFEEQAGAWFHGSGARRARGCEGVSSISKSDPVRGVWGVGGGVGRRGGWEGRHGGGRCIGGRLARRRLRAQRPTAR